MPISENELFHVLYVACKSLMCSIVWIKCFIVFSGSETDVYMSVSVTTHPTHRQCDTGCFIIDFDFIYWKVLIVDIFSVCVCVSVSSS